MITLRYKSPVCFLQLSLALQREKGAIRHRTSDFFAHFCLSVTRRRSNIYVVVVVVLVAVGGDDGVRQLQTDPMRVEGNIRDEITQRSTSRGRPRPELCLPSANLFSR